MCKAKYKTKTKLKQTGWVKLLNKVPKKLKVAKFKPVKP